MGDGGFNLEDQMKMVNNAGNALEKKGDYGIQALGINRLRY